MLLKVNTLKGWKKLRNLWIGSLIFLTFLATYLYVNKNNKSAVGTSRIKRIASLSCPQQAKKRNTLNPPKLTEEEEKRINFLHYSKDNEIALDQVSDIVQKQIQSIQTDENCDTCDGPNFLCGHSNVLCGFACQVHHWVGCLMMSYSLSLPLIHNTEEGWIYSKKRNDIFEPMGTNCIPGNNTYRWDWLLVQPSLLLYRGSKVVAEIENPLQYGLKVPAELKDIVDKFHPNPFLWWVGQFLKLAMKPTEDFQTEVNHYKKAIGFSHPIVGIHIRRTDKVTEAPGSYHEVAEYLNVAAHWYHMSAANSANKSMATVGENSYTNGKKNVFIATDDSDLLLKAQKRYARWNLRGFQANETLSSPLMRNNSLDEIVRDLLILAECDYIVCGLSSNVCRLLLEMLSSKYIDSQQRLASLDGEYYYPLHTPFIYPKPNQTLIVVEPRGFQGLMRPWL